MTDIYTCLFVLSNLLEIVIWKEKNFITSEKEKFLLSVGVTTGDCDPGQVRLRRPNKNIIRNFFRPKQIKKKKVKYTRNKEMKRNSNFGSKL